MISYERFKELCESIGLKEKEVFSSTFKIFTFSFPKIVKIFHKKYPLPESLTANFEERF